MGSGMASPSHGASGAKCGSAKDLPIAPLLCTPFVKLDPTTCYHTSSWAGCASHRSFFMLLMSLRRSLTEVSGSYLPACLRHPGLHPLGRMLRTGSFQFFPVFTKKNFSEAEGLPPPTEGLVSPLQSWNKWGSQSLSHSPFPPHLHQLPAALPSISLITKMHPSAGMATAALGGSSQNLPGGLSQPSSPGLIAGAGSWQPVRRQG